MTVKKKSNEKVIRSLAGKVIKIVDDNTVKVEVERKAAHPLYGKIMKSHKKYVVAANSKELSVGDIVTIIETRPVSKKKSFKIIKKANK